MVLEDRPDLSALSHRKLLWPRGPRNPSNSRGTRTASPDCLQVGVIGHQFSVFKSTHALKCGRVNNFRLGEPLGLSFKFRTLLFVTGDFDLDAHIFELIKLFEIVIDEEFSMEASISYRENAQQQKDAQKDFTNHFHLRGEVENYARKLKPNYNELNAKW
jgi:hypothetical protein